MQMKIGKVFEKQAARKPVANIFFYAEDGTESTDNAVRCTVYLKPGYSSNGATFLNTKSAHETRLFIDAVVQGEMQTDMIAETVAPVEAAPANAVPVAPTEETEDNTIVVAADWVRARARGLVERAGHDADVCGPAHRCLIKVKRRGKLRLFA
jgi:hypothetical protein